MAVGTSGHVVDDHQMLSIEHQSAAGCPVTANDIAQVMESTENSHLHLQNTVIDTIIDSATKSKLIVHITESGNDYEWQCLLDKEAAIRHSPYLRALLSCNSADAQTAIKLSEVKVEEFQLFADFLGTGRILSEHQDDDVERLGNGYTRDAEWVRLADAWLLGERLASTTFKDAVVDAIVLKMQCDSKIPVGMYRMLWSPEAPRVCGLKRLLMDLAVAYWDEETRWLDDLRGRIEDEEDFLKSWSRLRRKLRCGGSADWLQMSFWSTSSDVSITTTSTRRRIAIVRNRQMCQLE